MTIFQIDVEQEIEAFTEKLDSLVRLSEVYEQLSDKASRYRGSPRSFAVSLLEQYVETGSLSGKQWTWVSNLLSQVEGMKPLYGNFKSIRVAFMLAGEHLKVPKIRLITENGRFAQLNFYPESDEIKVYVDGWQGHGYRKYAGSIEDGMIKPYSLDRLSDDVRMAIESLANDPIGASKAFAQKLGACIYCGSRLSTDASKHYGYGPTCASHYGLPYDQKAA